VTLQETLDEVLRLYRQAVWMHDAAVVAQEKRRYISYLAGRRDTLEAVLSILGEKRR